MSAAARARPVRKKANIATEDSKFITCILNKGDAIKLVTLLKRKKGIIASNMSTARGTGMASPQGRQGVGQQIEKDIVTIIVPAKRAEEIFEFIFLEGGINRPHGGFMYQGNLTQATPYSLPEGLPEFRSRN